MSLKSFFGRLLGSHNIKCPSWEPRPWDPAQVEDSLRKMLTHVDKTAQAAIDWYWDKKRWKAITSRSCRLGTILSTAAAAAFPIVASTGWIRPPTAEQAASWALKMNQAGYLCLGLAGLLLALDRFLSGSASWMRYVSAATSIQTAVEQFHLDWDKLTASLAGKTPAGQDLMALINRIAEFSLTVRAVVENETKAWVAEFQANLAEIQKSTDAAVETMRAQLQVAQQKADTEQQAARPGGIELTVENAGDTDAGYEVAVDGRIEKGGVKSGVCAIPGVSPGLHDLSVRATIEGTPANASKLVTITAGAATQVQVALSK